MKDLTVKELIEFLEGFDHNIPIIIIDENGKATSEIFIRLHHLDKHNELHSLYEGASDGSTKVLVLEG